MVYGETGRSTILRSLPEGLDGKTGEILRGVQILRQPGEVAEVRAFSGRGTISGYFDDYQELARRTAELDDRGYQTYMTLHPVFPDLLARSSNRLETRPKATTADGDVVKRIWLPIDLDPVRPSGISATEFEKQAATHRAEEIKGYLAEKGYPDPLEADSGNGAHLLYRVDLPSDAESLDLVKRVLSALDFVFSDNTVNVDTGVANTARIWKLYGTTARKGTLRKRGHTAEPGCLALLAYSTKRRSARSRLGSSDAGPSGTSRCPKTRCSEEGQGIG
jgi:hypothetical protein